MVVATIGGVPIDIALSSNSNVDRTELADKCKHQSRSIIQEKGATPLGMGAVVSSICLSILSDRRNVRPISHFQPEFGCCFSLPVVLGRKGIVRTIQMQLDEDESAKIAESAKAERRTLDEIHKE